MSKRRIGAVAAVVAILAGLLTGFQVVGRAEPANAAVGSDFNAGYIISDAQMYNGTAMTASQVQQFLLGQVPTCASGSTCLINYAQATPSMPASSYCAAYQGASSESAATIIAKVGAACNISQEALLTLLQKEQSLVTSLSPTSTAFAQATGFACPDSTGCNPSYSGFFYQVYDAARQFQVYRALPASFNYQAGRSNNILYNPNPACGSSSVFIQNAATAGLYDYTPYQPDAAALANLYGTGDSCSSYGNRNFWRIYSDWFGSPTGPSSLVRTTTNATVYLVSGSAKYPISSLDVMNALAPLGPVSYVSQAYLDGFTTGITVGRVIRSPGGTVYFFDSGTKYAFTSCSQVADYGGSCSTNGYIQLTQAQVDTLVTGPNLTNVLGTTSGARYYISQGVKQEIQNSAAQTAAGLPAGFDVVTDAAVAALKLGTPLTVDSSFIQTRGTSTYSFLAGGKLYSVPAASASTFDLPASAAGSLSAASLALLPSAGVPFTGVVSAGGVVSVLATGGRYQLSAGAGGSSALSPVPVVQSFASAYPSLGTIAAGTFVKSPESATIYTVMPTELRPIGAWDSLVALTPPGQTPTWATVPTSFTAALPKGPVVLQSGTLARTTGSATVYFINGVTNKIPLSSFDYTSSAGFTGFSYAPDAQLNAYPTSSTLFGYGITCGTTNYVGAGGSLHAISSALAPLFPLTFVQLDPFACQDATIGAPATSFIRTPDGTIYQLSGGKKLHVLTMARLAQLGGSTGGWLNVSTMFAALYPTGPDA